MAASSTFTAGAARRYARALFDLCLESDALDAVDGDLRALSAALDESADLRDLIRSPIYTRAEQRDAIAAVAAAMNLSDLTRNVVGLMASKRRLFALPHLIAMFRTMLADHRGEMTADVTAARPLSDTQAATLADRINASTGRTVKLNVTVDEAIIGGLVVKVGSKMIDTSIRSRLTSLHTSMKEVR